MFCAKCGIQLADDAVFCIKCGAKQTLVAAAKQDASPEATQVKCSSCGAPITPKFGEMVISCEYCGSSISLESTGWQNITKHYMLPITISDKDQITARLHNMMDKGLLHRHLQESLNSKSLTF